MAYHDGSRITRRRGWPDYPPASRYGSALTNRAHGWGAPPRLTVASFNGRLALLFSLARRRQIDLELSDLLEQLAAVGQTRHCRRDCTLDSFVTLAVGQATLFPAEAS
jgi:hypothetical protein